MHNIFQCYALGFPMYRENKINYRLCVIDTEFVNMNWAFFGLVQTNLDTSLIIRKNNTYELIFDLEHTVSWIGVPCTKHKDLFTCAKFKRNDLTHYDKIKFKTHD